MNCLVTFSGRFACVNNVESSLSTLKEGLRGIVTYEPYSSRLLILLTYLDVFKMAVASPLSVGRILILELD